jgi:acetylornithine deacetylase/succinyl-diaminopimelate desuccinylase-like protein
MSSVIRRPALAILTAGAVLMVWSGPALRAQQTSSTFPMKRTDLGPEIAQAKAVLANPKVQAALKYVDEPESQKETIEQWLHLVNTYSPTGSEIYKARHLAKLFNIYGLENVHIDDAKNVIGIRPGTGGGPTIVLNAHFDAVALWPHDQPVNAFIADGRIWGPAAGDDLMGMQQVVSVIRAMNAAKLQTKGDVWFVGFTGEEQGSEGAGHFARANKHLLDWKQGAIVAQLHGGGGEGVTTGSSPYIQFAQLRFYTPLMWDRWKPSAVLALGRAIARIYTEVYDPKSLVISEYEPIGDMSQTPLYINLPMLEANPIHNGSVPQASVRFDMRSPNQQKILDAQAQIRKIAEEICREMGEGVRYTFEVNMDLGTEGIAGYDKANNKPARVAAAASVALYGTEPMIDPDRGCGDCRRSYMNGVPAMSFRGWVRDKAGAISVNSPKPLQSTTRVRTSGHNVTESAEIDRVWSGIKHALVFIATYSGLSESSATSTRP